MINNKVLSFFDIVLDFTYFIGKLPELKKNFSKITTFSLNPSQQVVIDLTQNFGKKITELVYSCLEEGKIKFLLADKEYTFSFSPRTLNIKIEPFDIIEPLEKIVEEYHHSFLSTNLVCRLKEKELEFLKSYKSFLKYDNIIELPLEIEEQFLSSYYELLKQIYMNPEYATDIDTYNELVNTLLYFNTKIQNSQIDFPLYHPLILKKVEDFYQQINQYSKTVQDEQLDESVHIIYKDMLIHHLKDSFCRLIPSQTERKEFPLEIDTMDENKNISFSILIDSMIQDLKERKQEGLHTHHFALLGKELSVDPSKIKEELRNRCFQEQIDLSFEIQIIPSLVNELGRLKIEEILKCNDSIYFLDDKDFLKKSIVENPNSQYYSQIYYYSYKEALEKVWNQFILADYRKKSIDYHINYIDNEDYQEYWLKFLNTSKKKIHIFTKSSSFRQRDSLIFTLNTGMAVKEFPNTKLLEVILNPKKNEEEKQQKQQFVFSLKEFYYHLILEEKYWREFEKKNKDFLDTIICIDYEKSENSRQKDEVKCFYTNPHQIETEILKKEIDKKWISLFHEIQSSKKKKIRKNILNSLYQLSSNFEEILLSYLLCGNGYGKEKKDIKNCGILAEDFIQIKQQRDFYLKDFYYLWIENFDLTCSMSNDQILMKYLLDYIYHQDDIQFNDYILEACNHVSYEDSDLHRNTLILLKRKNRGY